jgi:hypothetical protein
MDKDGTQKWYQHGKLHRDGDFPAEIYPELSKSFYSGSQRWYKHDKRYRDSDLPAVILSDGVAIWYENDVEIKKCADYRPMVKSARN